MFFSSKFKLKNIREDKLMFAGRSLSVLASEVILRKGRVRRSINSDKPKRKGMCGFRIKLLTKQANKPEITKIRISKTKFNSKEQLSTVKLSFSLTRWGIRWDRLTVLNGEFKHSGITSVGTKKTAVFLKYSYSYRPSNTGKCKNWPKKIKIRNLAIEKLLQAANRNSFEK